MMNKLVKKLSAVAIAAAMTLSTGVAAQAATVQVYPGCGEYPRL